MSARLTIKLRLTDGNAYEVPAAWVGAHVAVVRRYREGALERTWEFLHLASRFSFGWGDYSSGSKRRMVAFAKRLDKLDWPVIPGVETMTASEVSDHLREPVLPVLKLMFGQ